MTSPAALRQPRPAVIIIVPVRTVSELNAHTHWRQRQKRAKAQRDMTWLYLVKELRYRQPLPVVITLTRLAPRKLDSDNLAGALKHVRDGVADFFETNDGDDRYTWSVEQEKSRMCGVRIEIVPAEGTR